MNLLAVAVAGRGLVDPGEPVFGAADEALLRGRAVFETLRVYGGRPFLLDAHVERLGASAARMRLPAPDASSCHELAKLVLDAAGETELALRFYWTGATLAATGGPIDPEIEELRARGLRLAVVRASRGALARAKSMSYAANMIARDDAIECGADDALLVGEDGIVLEASTSNIWWRTGDRLFTPSLELPILAGVTRSLVLELSPYPVEEGTYLLEQLLAADEAFLTSSVREVMPVRAIDEPEFALGPAAAALQAALRERALGVTDAHSTRRRPNAAELALLDEVLGQDEAWPGLRERVAQGAEIQEDDAERLEATILTAFLRELDDKDEPTARGKKIDELLGLISQLRVGYYG